MSEHHREAAVADAKQTLAWWGALLAAAGVVGLVLRTDLYVIWVFLIAFGTATLPVAALRKLRKLRSDRRAR